MDEARDLTGRLLLALPGIGDPRFERSVIALCAHDERGAFGIGIGQLRDGLRLRALLEDIGMDPGVAPDCPVVHGGPVEPGRGFVLHTPDWSGEGTVAVEGLGALSGTLDVLRAITEGAGPRRWLFALGYAGWGAGQLDGEMRRHGWFVAQGRPEILFDTPVERRWAATWQAEGIDPALLASESGRA